MLVGQQSEIIKERSKLIRSAFDRLDKDALRVKFFEQQSGTCFRCGELLESVDGVFSEVGHITSVLDYASSTMSIEDAIKNANCEGNLVLLHTSCNRSQNAADLQEEIESGVDLYAPKKLTPEDMEWRRKRAAAGGKIGGKISGRKAVESGQLTQIRHLPQTKNAQRISGQTNGRKSVESGQLAQIRQLPQTKKAQRISGQVNGRQNAESGYLASIRTFASCSKGGKISGQKKIESGQLASIRTFESCSKGGKISGKRNVESGQLASIKTFESCSKGGKIAVESGQLASITTYESCSKGGKIGGQVSGLRAVESGQLARIRQLPQTKEAQSRAGQRNVESGQLARIRQLAIWIRWHPQHIARGIVNPKCSLCQTAQEAAA